MTHTRREAPFVILFIVLLIAVLEAGARLAISYPPVFRRVARQSSTAWRLEWATRHRRLVPSRYAFDAYHPTRGWTLKAGLSSYAMPGGSRLTTNSRGLRSEVEIPYGHPAQGKRIAVLGDSFTFGEEVSDRETYSFVLDALLPQDEVLNFGVHGYGLDQMLLYLREEVLQYHPDVVLLGYVDEDIYRDLLSFRDYAKPRFRLLADQSLCLENVPVPPPEVWLSREIYYPRALDLLVMAWEARKWRNGATRLEAEEISAALLAEVVRATRAAGALPVVVYLPVEAELTDHSAALNRGERFLSSVCSREGLRLHSLRADLSRGIDPGDRRATHGHWPAAIHARAAALMRDILREEEAIETAP